MCQEHAILIWAAVEHMRTAGTVEPKVRPLPTASEIEGCVYYIRIGDRVKIGHTTNPSKRLATYPPQTEILALRRGSKELEHREHVRFSEHRTDGREWFHANERVLHMIAEIPDVDHDWEPEWFQRRTHTPQIVEHRKAKNAKAGNGHA